MVQYIQNRKGDLLLKKVVVLDVDDVIVDLNGRVEIEVSRKYPDFSFERVFTYDFNKSLTAECKKLVGISEEDPWNGVGAPSEYILSKYGLVDSFRGVHLFDIPRLAELCRKCDVVFHTSGVTVDVCKFKLAYLNALLDTLGVCACVSVELLGNMVYVNFQDTEPQGVVDRCFVSKPALVCDFVIEDCLGNLRGYSGCRKFIVDKPWNNPTYNPSYNDVTSSSTRVANVNEAIDIILEMVEDEE